MMNKIFFFDIDGTLALHGHIPKSNIEALQKLKEKGYLTFICTGRAGHYAKKLFKDLVSGYIACNGRYIIYQNKRILGKSFQKDELTLLKKKFNQLNCGYLLASDDVSVAIDIHDKDIPQLYHDYGKEHIIFHEDNLPIYAFDLFYDNLDHRDYIIEELKNDIVFNDHGGHGSGDCSTLNFDKGHAIKYLLDYFHIDKDNAYAFGDGYNDQAMFREVSHSIAMGNAIELLKQQASYITDDISNDGILKALVHENIIKNKQ